MKPLSWWCERMLVLCLGAFLTAHLSCRPAGHDEPAMHREASRIALSWNKFLLEIEKGSAGYRPPVSARTFAYVEMAAYEAARPALPDHVALSRFCPQYVVVAPPDSPQYCLPLALNAAYARIIQFFFPQAPLPVLEKIEKLETQNRNTLLGACNPDVVRNSEEFGKQTAEAVWHFSQTDTLGHNGYLFNFDRSYVPPRCDGCWQPDPDNSIPPLLPHWGDVRPFVVGPKTIDARPPMPWSKQPGSAFYTEALEVYTTSQTLSEEDKWIAEFWSDDIPGLTTTPSGRWIAIANQAMEKARPPFSELITTYLKIGWALCDAGIICWHYKYQFNLERPISYINQHIDPRWQPLHPNPVFPAYPSGHAIFAGAAAEVLIAQFGDQFELTDRLHETRLEFDGQPRTFPSFSEMAQECAFSRLLLGVHYRMDCEEGLRLGKTVGKRIADLPLTVQQPL